MTDDLRCPVCEASFGNPGALATHAQRTKDAAHVAGRSGALAGLEAAPTSPPASPPPPSRIASPQAGDRGAASREAGEATLLPALGDALGEASAPATPSPGPTFATLAASEPDQGGVEYLALPPPRAIEPLLPLPDALQAGAAASPKALPIVVPLEPIFAGAATAALNGFVLNKPTDGELTVDMVRATGFPQAAEACLRLYFPDLPLDHPLTALIASGASLAVLVVSLKGKGQQQQPGEAKAGEGDARPGDADEPASPAPPGPSTGDPYWDRILASAGGVQA